MPKRSNEFQRLIYLIQKQVSPNASVNESKLLLDDRSRAKTEVDIVIESEIAGISIVVGVECTASQRPATVE